MGRVHAHKHQGDVIPVVEFSEMTCVSTTAAHVRLAGPCSPESEAVDSCLPPGPAAEAPAVAPSPLFSRLSQAWSRRPRCASTWARFHIL